MSQDKFPLFKISRSGKAYVTRIYTDGHDTNLLAWMEEITEEFASFLKKHGDDPNCCHLHGDPKHLYMRFTPRLYAVIKNEPGKSKVMFPVTMIRVHRGNAPKHQKRRKYAWE